jgi:adenylate cyclase
VAPTLDAIRGCLEGSIPSVIATCAPDGAPNVTFLSHVHFVDPEHVALSYQFFNKTRRNVLANPRATVQVVDPDTGAHYRLALNYLRTETDGPLFEHMKARLAGIASHVGMSKVFRLQGADVYRVLAIEAVPGPSLPCPPPRRGRLAALRACARRIGGCGELGHLLDEALAALDAEFGIGHAMLLMGDPGGDRLYTVASRGYPESGVGSEIALGEGIIGVAARERVPIRIGHMAREYRYADAVRKGLRRAGPGGELETEIPPPGLPDSRSQMALPMLLGERLVGVLYVESPEAMRFGYEDEDALAALASQLALAVQLLARGEGSAEAAAPAPGARPTGAPVTVRHYPENDSVFLDEDYLIKGVAGAIFRALVQEHVRTGRTAFTNRELRLDPSIRLPDVSENLEARLILLQRRLADRCDCVRIEKTGRGRFRLSVTRPLKLREMPAGPPG